MATVPPLVHEWSAAFWQAAKLPQNLAPYSESDLKALKHLIYIEGHNGELPPQVGTNEHIAAFRVAAGRAGLTITPYASAFVGKHCSLAPQVPLMYAFAFGHWQRECKPQEPVNMHDVEGMLPQGVLSHHALLTLWVLQKEGQTPHGANQLNFLDLS